MSRPRPNEGGTYRRLPDGSLEQLQAPTGERPCRCREHASDEVASVIAVEENQAEPEAPAVPAVSRPWWKPDLNSKE